MNTIIVRWVRLTFGACCLPRLGPALGCNSVQPSALGCRLVGAVDGAWLRFAAASGILRLSRAHDQSLSIDQYEELALSLQVGACALWRGKLAAGPSVMYGRLVGFLSSQDGRKTCWLLHLAILFAQDYPAFVQNNTHTAVRGAAKKAIAAATATAGPSC